MKIAVFGAGAVGSALGGFLQQAGHKVTLIGREPHMSTIHREGLRIEGIRGSHHLFPEAHTAPPSGPLPDLILLTVKSIHTEESARILRSWTGGRVPVLHFQNGIGNYEILSRFMDPTLIYTGMVIIGFTIPAPGVVEITVYGGPMKVGRMGEVADRKVREVAALFDSTPLKADPVDSINSHLWAKLLYNASLNPLSALLQVPYGDLLQPAAMGIIRALLVEAFAVSRALEIPLFWKESAQYAKHLEEVLIPATAEHHSSMLADIRAGRKTEIDFLNGALVRYGEQYSIPTPVNDTLVTRIRALERSKGSPPLTPALLFPGEAGL